MCEPDDFGTLCDNKRHPVGFLGSFLCYLLFLQKDVKDKINFLNVILNSDKPELAKDWRNEGSTSRNGNVY